MRSKAINKSWEMLKRLGRYLGRPRLAWKYKWQSPQDIVDIHSDANWAGCRECRKSMSGGTIAIGQHLTKSYSKTQAFIDKRSGDSKLYGVVRASAEGLGVVTLLGGFGVPGMKARVGIDAQPRTSYKGRA